MLGQLVDPGINQITSDPNPSAFPPAHLGAGLGRPDTVHLQSGETAEEAVTLIEAGWDRVN